MVDQWWDLTAACQGEPRVGQIGHSACCAVPFSGSVWPRGVITWKGTSYFLFSAPVATADMRRNEKPIPTCHPPVIPQKLSWFWLHGNAFPCPAWEYLSSATTSDISNEACWKGKWSQPEKERALSTACQELTSMDRGLHTRTVPLSSYCSAGSCFWSVWMCCQRRTFLNIVMNSATDSTAIAFQLPNGKLAWYHRGSLLRVRLSYGATRIKCP